MQYRTAVRKLARVAPTEAQWYRELHARPSHELREYVAREARAVTDIRSTMLDPAVADEAVAQVRLAAAVAQRILAGRVCVAS